MLLPFILNASCFKEERTLTIELPDTSLRLFVRYTPAHLNMTAKYHRDTRKPILKPPVPPETLLNFSSVQWDKMVSLKDCKTVNWSEIGLIEETPFRLMYSDGRSRVYLAVSSPRLRDAMHSDIDMGYIEICADQAYD